MTQLTLTYFDFNGGRAEPARLAFAIGGIPFEDKRFAFPEFAEVRKQTPFGQVPTLHVDGVQITQSDAITRYAGKLAKLYPTDPYQALLCDEVLQAMEDLNVKLGASFGMTGDALREAREAFVSGPLSTYLRWLQAQLLARGGEYFADQRLTVADLKVFVFVRGVVSGRLDHVPTTIVEQLAPTVAAHMQRIAALPAVAAYYAKFAK
ncbi:MAG: glutathione S-transferase [Rhodoferax sp.]|nr:MAG: glutathione S-transferase [Rhodoferax sp.]